MRLTLRTLLAYLDDTLEAEQAKMIGQKVAESPVAQELVERLRKVTRRRSLANPPVHGDTSRLDANTVAEYLDSSLGADDLSQVEQTCLDDDVYLAEVAACHQILTLMLSEPARVPPTARQRMYRLVKGRESIPYRRPPTMPLDTYENERELAHRSARRERFAASLGIAAILLIGLVVSLALAWPRSSPTRSPRLAEIAAVSPPPVTVPAKPPVKADPAVSPVDKPSSDQPVVDSSVKPKPPVAAVDPPRKPEDLPKKPIDQPPPARKPSDERREIADLVSNDGILLERKLGNDESWRTAKRDRRLAASDIWMCLPGYRTEINLDGIRVSMWGILDYYPVSGLESVLTAHTPATGIDAELTLDRGRILIANNMAKRATVRLHYHGETWDLTLNDKSELLADGFVKTAPGQRFSKDAPSDTPLMELYVGVTKGQVTVRQRDMNPVTMAAPAVLEWNNKGRPQAPKKLSQPLPQWSLTVPTQSPAKEIAADFKVVLESLNKRLAQPDATIEVALTEFAQDERPAFQVYAAYSLAGIGQIAPLVDALGDLLNPNLRGTSIVALRNWIAWQPENAMVLHRMLRDKKDYSESQADALMQMLYTFSENDVFNAATYEFLFTQLNDEKLAVRELAFWHLSLLDPDGVKESRYTPIVPDRPMAIARWQKRLTEGKIPPKPRKPADAPKASETGKPESKKP